MCNHYNLQNFLNSRFSSDFTLEKIPQDAGIRSYYRIFLENKTYILSKCSPEYPGLGDFIKIADYLRGNKFTTPKIIASDLTQGFLILEDFGDITIKKYLMSANQIDSDKVYYLMIDLLIEIQKLNNVNLDFASDKLLLEELEVFIRFYIPYARHRDLKSKDLEQFKIIWQDILSRRVKLPSCLTLRDFHSENIMYLSKNKSINKLGLLDFQDAIFSCPSYDLVSLLEDARIDVSRDKAIEYVRYFCKRKQLDYNDLLCNYHILGTQRNIRILGVFARKYISHKDDRYLRYIPRILGYLNYSMDHSNLTKFKNWFLAL